MTNFFSQHQKAIAFLLGIILFVFFYWANPFTLAAKASLVLAVAALLPIVLFPLTGISPIKEVTKSYADSNIFLFMGGFFIGIAIEKWNLHKRIALSIINITGTNGNRIILGFIIATGFLSMWLSNTATTMMMFPIATSVINVIENHNKENTGVKNFSLVLMLCLAYASNFAIGTIIGTPPNVAYAGYIQDKFNYGIGFLNWMLVFTPLTIILMLMLYWVMVKWLYPNNIKHSAEGKSYIKKELQQLGKLSTPEKRVLIIFCCTIFLWIVKDAVNNLQKVIVLDDTIIALLGAITLFVVPSKVENKQLLEWQDTSKMAWGILLLFGGGIALAKSLEDVKIMEQLGNYIASYSTTNIFAMILIVTTISVFLSEVMSNVAQVIVMAPVITSVAIALKIDPLLLGIPMTLGASCASMLPMGTPPNAIVFASGHIKLKDMLKTGFVLNIICIIFITIFCWLLQPLVMGLR
jgi:solute carrier family 13 (sodium-dependent dicarboxylate transporter), member 2/3/5